MPRACQARFATARASTRHPVEHLHARRSRRVRALSRLSGPLVRQGDVLLRAAGMTNTHTHTHTNTHQHTTADAIDMPLVHEKVGATCSTKVLVENPTDKPVTFTVSAANVSALPCKRRVQMHV